MVARTHNDTPQKTKFRTKHFNVEKQTIEKKEVDERRGDAKEGEERKLLFVFPTVW